MRAIRELGVTGVVFEGPVRLGPLRVLGKGYSGVVLAARYRRRPAALKLRRIDSPRRTSGPEARLLAAANRAGVGPRLYAHSRDAIVMERIEGEPIADWAAGLRGRDAKKARKVLAGLLDSCRALDSAGIDHGELSMISKHAIIQDGLVARLVDFESASLSRRVSNVTSAAQALFIGASLSSLIRQAHRAPPRRTIIPLLRKYKSEMSDESYGDLIGGLGLER